MDAEPVLKKVTKALHEAGLKKKSLGSPRDMAVIPIRHWIYIIDILQKWELLP